MRKIAEVCLCYDVRFCLILISLLQLLFFFRLNNDLMLEHRECGYSSTIL